MNILVVGDLILDEYKEGLVERISPEAPIPILDVKHSYLCLGGAGNLVANLSGLGHVPYIIGAVGDDATGDILMKKIKDISVPVIKKVQSMPTSHKIRFCSSGQHILRVDQEWTHPLDLFSEIESLKNVKFDYIILSDYAKGVITYDLISTLYNRYYSESYFILDPNIKNIKLYDRLTEPIFSYITPNRKEAEALNRGYGDTIFDIARNLTRLSKNVIVTLGGSGMYVLYLKDKIYFSEPLGLPFDNTVRDVSGAGDTVVAALVDGLSKGMPIVKAASYAQKLAQIVVTKKGTYAIRKSDYEV